MKIEAAITDASNVDGTDSKVAVLIGAVETKSARHDTANRMKKVVVVVAKRQPSAAGAATRLDSAESESAARTRSVPGQRSPSDPPSAVPQMPVTASTTPSQRS